MPSSELLWQIILADVTTLAFNPRGRRTAVITAPVKHSLGFGNGDLLSTQTALRRT